MIPDFKVEGIIEAIHAVLTKVALKEVERDSMISFRVSYNDPSLS